MTIRIVTDSTCDLPEETIQRHAIVVLPLFINADGQGYRDGIDITRQEFYERLPGWTSPPTTAAPGPEVFRQTYERLADEGATQVLSIHISASLSSTLGVARAGAEQTQKVPVTVFDSRQLSLGTGFLVERAAQAVEAGKEIVQILELLKEQIVRSHVFAALDTLEFLRRSGRVNWLVARLGSLLKVKPILRMYDGEPIAERVRTTEQAWRRMIGWLEELAPLERVAMVHTNALEQAEALYERVAHLLPKGQVPFMNVTPVLGVHLGPGAAGFATISAPK
ncbi:MAG: DegV family protein [Anaerolineae bacterium]|nr:DegV family protein [Anaerolineae bacterium]